MSDDLTKPVPLRPDPAKIIVPRKHAQVLIEPAMGSLVRVMEDCRSKPGGCGATGMFAGRPMADLKAGAREHFLAEAVQWAKLTETPLPDAAAHAKAWVITGHQVEFYHAGVWAKVIAADELAKRTGAVAFDILVDHDTIEHLGFDVPTQEGELWKRTPIHWAAGADLPAEAIAAPSAEEFERWDTQLAFHLHAHTDSLAFMLAALKPRADASNAKPVAGSYVPWLSGARGKLERALDVNVHQVPASLLCSGDTWWTFVAAWMENVEAWREVYNKHLAAYRKRQGIKNLQHPMPDLTRRVETGDAAGGPTGIVYELPFWIYKIGEARQRLFVRKMAGKTTFLHDGIEHPLAGDFRFENSEFQIRPRALTLTMYTRLFLADLFIHGIGGALYDQITDGILADLFGAAPPYACVSAAWLLPLGLPLENIDDIPLLKTLRHHVLHNPQQALDPFTALKTDVAELITARKNIVEQIASSLATARKDKTAIFDRREKFRELHQINEQLHQKAPNIIAKLDRQLEEAQRAREQNKVLLWREYFYALHTTHSLVQLIAKVRAG